VEEIAVNVRGGLLCAAGVITLPRPMKAERRHELQQNTLAKFINDLPVHLQMHANKLLIGVVIVCALIFLMRYRTSAVIQNRETARNSVTAARAAVEQLKSIQFLGGSEIAQAEERRSLAGQVEAAIDQVLQTTKDPDDSAMRADALVLRGDLNWTLANMPPIPGATTQPALGLPHSPAEYLDNAEGAYQEVLKDYNSQMVPKATALLGLAAIEENRGGWDKAAGYFSTLVSDPAMAETFKAMARHGLGVIPQLRNPAYLGSYSSTQPGTQPSTQPTR
jgi:hypothetical protein